MKNPFKKWEKYRAMGKWRFILVYGGLVWGLTTAVLFSILFSLLVSGKGSFLTVFTLALFLFPLGGLAWGHTMWILGEHAHKTARNNEELPTKNKTPLEPE